MIEKVKYIEDDWEKFERATRFVLQTHDEIMKRCSASRFEISTEKIMMEISTIDDDNDTLYLMFVDRVYEGGLTLDQTISKIKKILTAPGAEKVFMKKKGDGYNECFMHHDGTVKTAYALSYHNSRGSIVFGLSHIYYGK